MIRKRLLSACLALALCLGLLPVTALAVDTAPQTLYVGSTTITAGYWTSSDDGTNWTSPQEEPTGDSYIYYDGQGTLKLHNATIQGGSTTESAPFGSGIYALSSSNQPVALTIKLIGENTITGDMGIYVAAEASATSYGTDASLTITSENNGSLQVSGLNYGIYVKSGTGNASLTINDASVVAKTTQTYSSFAGVYVQSSAHATSSPQLSLAVNGGSLTASASEGNDGIQFYVGSSEATDATTRLTVSENAIVDARNGGISASRILVTLPTPTPTGNNSSGIVFDGSAGTVYGDVTLQEDLTIGEGESLKLDDGASLSAGSHNVIVDGGTLGEGFNLGDSVKYAPTITTTNLPNGTVGTSYNQTLAADGTTPITWSIESGGTLPAGLQLENGVITGTPTTAGTSTFTVKAENSYGSDSKKLSITINEPATISVTGVSLDQSALTITEGDTVQLTATVEPSNATNKGVTWSSSAENVATVEDGNVTAVGAGEATITVTTEDGSCTANCTVTVREDVPDRPVSIPDTHEIELIAGEGGEAKTNFSNAGAGTKITVAATPNDGYELAYITVDGERIDGTTFKMPAHDVTVRVYFTGGALPFADAAEGAWYADAVSYVCANGLMDGVSASEFAPEANMTRAMVWTILARIDGETITGTSWAEDARAWAMESGVSDGTDPNGLVTREQLAAMLYRYAGEPAVSGSLSTFTDAASVSAYAADATAWCVEQGIITGTTATTLAPQGAATRAQCAAMLMRFAER